MISEELKFVRLFVNYKKDEDLALAAHLFNSVPKYLFEQVKDTDFDMDRLYQFGLMMLVNPLTYFYVMVEKEKPVIKGILWAQHNLLSDQLSVLVFSVDKEYQNNGAMEVSKQKLLEIKKENNIEGSIITVTTRPKAVEKVGWKRSNKIVMEIE